MTPPRDLADAQARLDTAQADLLASIERANEEADRAEAALERLDKVRDYAQAQRKDAETLRAIGLPYAARAHDNTATALERIIGDQQ